MYFPLVILLYFNSFILCHAMYAVLAFIRCDKTIIFAILKTAKNKNKRCFFNRRNRRRSQYFKLFANNSGRVR